MLICYLIRRRKTRVQFSLFQSMCVVRVQWFRAKIDALQAEIQRQLPASANSKMAENIVLQQETQCSVLGIPRAFLLSSRGGTAVSAVAQQSNSIVASTIQWWRVVLGRLLTVVYHQVSVQVTLRKSDMCC